MRFRGRSLAVRPRWPRCTRNFGASPGVFDDTARRARTCEGAVRDQNVFYFRSTWDFVSARTCGLCVTALVVNGENEVLAEFSPAVEGEVREGRSVNERISARSFARVLAVSTMLRPSSEEYDSLSGANDEDAARLVEMGRLRTRPGLQGNLKFDVPPPAETALIAQLRGA